jgi:hypothetical protein
MESPTWSLILGAARELGSAGAAFTWAALIGVVQRDPRRRADSIGPVLQRMTRNATGGVPSVSVTRRSASATAGAAWPTPRCAAPRGEPAHSRRPVRLRESASLHHPEDIRVEPAFRRGVGGAFAP